MAALQIRVASAFFVLSRSKKKIILERQMKSKYAKEYSNLENWTSILKSDEMRF